MAVVSKRFKKELLNVPNLLTYMRIALIPLIIYFLEQQAAWPCFLAAIFFIVASITDVLDGFLARTYGQISLMGKFIDPLADKLIVLSVLIYLVAAGRFQPWLLIVILVRELAITGLRAVAAGEGMVIAASDSAKMKTALQLVGIVGLIVHYRYHIDFLIGETDVHFHRVGLVLVYMSVVLSVYSAWQYFKGFYRAIDA